MENENNIEDGVYYQEDDVSVSELDVYLHIIKRTETTGCEMEDGGDTRETKTMFFIIPDKELENFNERAADDYGYQDYSYQVDYTTIAKIGYWEIYQLADKLNEWIKKNPDPEQVRLANEKCAGLRHDATDAK